MRPPRVYRTEAVILRDRKIGEADKVLTLFTAEQGKFDAIAKGVRRPMSRKSGHLEVLSHSSLLLAHGRSLDVITQCETLASFSPLRDDLQRLSRALYVSELVDRFTMERQENRALYHLMLETLAQLATGSELDLTLRSFEVQMLTLSGYQPQLRTCAACSGPISPVVNYFSPMAGGVVCAGCRASDTAMRPLTVNALKVLRLLQAGTGGNVARLRLSEGLGGEIEAHLRLYIRHILEREVRSRDFIRSLRADAADTEPRAMGERVLS